MKVIVFGATGMVGQAMLAQCLGDSGIDEVLVIGRSPVGRRDDKREILHTDFSDFSALAVDFAGADACFFCLGVSSVGMKEPEYRRVTKDFTLAAADALVALAPQLVFVYISGMGTDSSEHGRVMWARVKGEVENALLAMPFRAYAVRPGFIQAVGGVRSKTPLYAALYRVTGWLYPLVRRIAPNYAIRSDELAAAMIELVRRRPEQRILESRDLRALLAPAP